MKMNCSKTLTKTDLERFVIPSESFPSFPQPKGGHHTKDFPVREESSGCIWWLRVNTRKTGKRKKPTLSKEWKKFCRFYKLEADDVVKFFKMKDEPIEYMVKVEKINRGTEEGNYMVEDPVSTLEVNDQPFYTWL